jgi:hypothetical protein
MLERWWTGTDWSSATHKAANENSRWLKPRQARLFWPGLNRDARAAEIVAYVALVPWLVLGVAVVVESRGLTPSIELIHVVLAVVVGCLVLLVWAFGARGLLRSSWRGGAGLATCAIALGVVMAFGAVQFLLLLS